MQRRLGRRGALLLLLGSSWILIGLSIYFGPPTHEQGAQYLFHEQLPHWLRLSLWASTGAIAVGFCLKEPPGTDTPGFMALIIMPLERVASYGWGYLLHLLDSSRGYPRGLYTMLVWLAITAAIMVMSGWAEPEHFDERGERTAAP